MHIWKQINFMLLDEDQDWHRQPLQEAIAEETPQQLRRASTVMSSAIHSMKVTVAPMFDRYVGAMIIN